MVIADYSHVQNNYEILPLVTEVVMYNVQCQDVLGLSNSVSSGGSS